MTKTAKEISISIPIHLIVFKFRFSLQVQAPFCFCLWYTLFAQVHPLCVAHKYNTVATLVRLMKFSQLNA